MNYSNELRDIANQLKKMNVHLGKIANSDTEQAVSSLGDEVKNISSSLEEILMYLKENPSS